MQDDPRDWHYVHLAGWFPLPHAHLLRRLIASEGVTSVLEIGTFCGLATLFFALQVERVTTVDLFTGSDETYLKTPAVMQVIGNQREIFDRNMEAFGVQRKIRTLAMPSTEALTLLAKEGVQFDLVYIDGSHEYAQVKTDIQLARPLARKVLCGDDYTRFWQGVCRAVDEEAPRANRNQRLWYELLTP